MAGRRAIRGGDELYLALDWLAGQGDGARSRTSCLRRLTRRNRSGATVAERVRVRRPIRT